MANPKRLTSSALLVVGIALVFAGFSRALGLTPTGILASLAAIGALLYAGAAWFGADAPPVPSHLPACIVFDAHRRIVMGGPAGQPVASGFPELLRPEIDRQCAAALQGASVRFPCLQNGHLVLFDALPVRSADGTINFGLLVSTDADAAAVTIPA